MPSHATSEEPDRCADATDCAADDAAGVRELANPGEQHCGLDTRGTLDVLAESLAGAALTPLGRVAAINELAYAVAVQRKVDTELDIAPAPRVLPAPVVVSGLPRSGVAHLHHLLALSPSLHVARDWEVASPTASAEARRTGDGKVVRDAMRLARVRSELLDVVTPRLPELAPMSSHSGEGCTQLLHHTLCSLQLVTMFHIPEYARWLCERDLDPAYGFWADELRLMRPGRDARWLGASPFHMFGYEALWSCAADAQIVHVRRDPLAAFEAFLDVAISVRRAFSEDVDPRAVASAWLDLWRTMLQRATIAARARRGQVVAVDGDQLRREPATAVAKLCSRLALEPPAGRAVSAMAAVLRERERDGRVPVESLGLRRSDVASALWPLQQDLDRAVDGLG